MIKSDDPKALDIHGVTLSRAIERGETKEIIRWLEQRSIEDHSRTGLSVLVAAIPFVGGPLQVLMEDTIPSRHKDRLYEALAEITISIARVHERLDLDKVQSETFEAVLLTALKKVQGEHRVRKRQAYQNVVVNCLLGTSTVLPDVELLYVHLLDSLSEQHLLVLSYLIAQDQNSKTSGLLLTQLAAELGTSAAVIRFLSQQLDQSGVTSQLLDRLVDTEITDIPLDDTILTDFGTGFINYISNPN